MEREGREFLGFRSPKITWPTAVILVDTRWQAGLDRWLSDSTFYHAPINACSKKHTDCGLEWYKALSLSALLCFPDVISVVSETELARDS
jgi:hypothetical protein